MTRSLFLALAAASLMLLAGSSASLAAPGAALARAQGVDVVQDVGYYKRRYRNDTHVRAPLTAVDDEDGDTWVRAPFARVYSGRAGTWVRAPFVNLWIPR